VKFICRNKIITPLHLIFPEANMWNCPEAECPVYMENEARKEVNNDREKEYKITIKYG